MAHETLYALADVTGVQNRPRRWSDSHHWRLLSELDLYHAGRRRIPPVLAQPGTGQIQRQGRQVQPQPDLECRLLQRVRQARRGDGKVQHPCQVRHSARR